MNTTYQYCFRIPNLAKMDCHQLISYSIAQSALISPHFVKPQPRPTTKTTIEPETHNWLPTLKPGDTIRIRMDKEKIWDTKESVIAQNDHPPNRAS